MIEAQDLLNKNKTPIDYMRVRAYPFTEEVQKFVQTYERIYVVEQNRDAQVLKLLQNDFPSATPKLRSVTNYDGLPLDAVRIVEPILKMEKNT